MNINTYIYIYIYKDIYTHTHTHTYIYKYIYIYLCTFLFTYTYTCMHTYRHSRMVLHIFYRDLLIWLFCHYCPMAQFKMCYTISQSISVMQLGWFLFDHVLVILKEICSNRVQELQCTRGLPLHKLV